jgi:hypothetical protein
MCYIGAMNWKFWALTAALVAAALPHPAPAAQVGSYATPAHQVASNSAIAQTRSTSQINANSNGNNPSATENQSSGNLSNSPECEGGNCSPPPPHITIATAAPAPAPWPWQDRIRWGAEILLFLLSYVAVFLALSTLHKIERNTRYAETAAQAAAESAKATLLYAEANTQSERPWILINSEPAPGAPDAFAVVATNRGRTPARIVAMADEIALAKDEAALPADPTFNEAGMHRPPVAMILLPGESISIKSFRRDEVATVCQSAEHLRLVENWEEKIYLFGKVTYVDLRVPDESKTYETIWCCWYIHGRQKSGMVLTGPRAYNQHS